jgi:hypothetical protein
MPPRAVGAVLLVLASACAGDVDAGPARGDYFDQLARVADTARIQERGLRRDLRVRLEDAAGGLERIEALRVFVDQSARLRQDVVDALQTMEPPEEVATAHGAYIEAWRAELDLYAAVREAGYTAQEILETLEDPAFRAATADRRSACESLASAVTQLGENVDLSCIRRAG